MALYAIGDSAARCEALWDAGVRDAQLRVKGATPEALDAEVAAAAAAARARPGARLWINDHFRLAARYDCYGCHLGQEDLAALSVADREALAAFGPGR